MTCAICSGSRAVRLQYCGSKSQLRSTQRHRGMVLYIEEAKLRRRPREIATDRIGSGRRMGCNGIHRARITVAVLIYRIL